MAHRSQKFGLGNRSLFRMTLGEVQFVGALSDLKFQIPVLLIKLIGLTHVSQRQIQQQLPRDRLHGDDG